MQKSQRIVLCASEADDTIYPGQDRGWVTSFSQYLALMIQSASGSHFRIDWINESTEISDNYFVDNPIFLIILSPDFLYSDKLTGHLNAFTASVKKELNAEQINQLIFKIVKSSIEDSVIPKVLENSISYELFIYDEDTGEPREIIDFFSPEGERFFWMRLVDLAYDIHETLLISKSESKDNVVTSGSRKAVYLAETGKDLAIQRNIIKRELQRHGYKVLPNKRLPATLHDLEKSIGNDLHNCQLSIHMISEFMGVRPEDTDETVPHIQHRIASDYSISLLEKGQREEFKRLYWVAPHIRESNEDQQEFIMELKQDAQGLRDSEILQSPLEDFKSAIWYALKKDVAPRRTYIHFESFKSDDQQIIYFIYDKADQDSGYKLAEYIRQKGFFVVTPTFEGNLLDIREFHIENLRNFDASIIFQEHVNSFWVKMKLLDLLKSPGFGRQKPILGKMILSGKGQAKEDSYFKNFDVDHQVASDDNYQAFIDRFLDEIQIQKKK